MHQLCCIKILSASVDVLVSAPTDALTSAPTLCNSLLESNHELKVSLWGFGWPDEITTCRLNEELEGGIHYSCAVRPCPLFVARVLPACHLEGFFEPRIRGGRRNCDSNPVVGVVEDLKKFDSRSDSLFDLRSRSLKINCMIVNFKIKINYHKYLRLILKKTKSGSIFIIKDTLHILEDIFC